MSDVNDRGTIKWTSIMLPEHINKLEEFWSEQEEKKKPILDEQEMEEIDVKLQCALQNDLTIIIKYFQNHDFNSIRVKINTIDVHNKVIVLNDSDKTSLKFNQLIDVFID
jgi:hypothetical protein